MKHEIEKLDKKGLRKFGLMTGAILAALFGLLLPWILDHTWPHWPWYIAGILWVLAIIFPIVLNPIYHVWMRFGVALGWINTRIILGIMFYLMFTPISLILMILRKDPMHRKKEPTLSSYRVITENHSIEHMERPY
jgi:MFS family permease